MASELFEKMGTTAPQQPTPQNPREQALALLRQRGFNISGMENNPEALTQMVMQSGMVPQNRLSLSQNVLMRLMGRR